MSEFIGVGKDVKSSKSTVISDSKEENKTNIEDIRRYLELEKKVGWYMRYMLIVIVLFTVISFCIEMNVKRFYFIFSLDLFLILSYFIYRSYQLSEITCPVVKSLSILLGIGGILTVAGIVLPVTYLTYMYMVSPVVLCMAIMLLFPSIRMIIKRIFNKG